MYITSRNLDVGESRALGWGMLVESFEDPQAWLQQQAPCCGIQMDILCVFGH